MTSKELRQARSFIVTVLVAVFVLFLMAKSRAGELYEYGIDSQGREYHFLSAGDAPPGEWEEQRIPVYINTDNMPIPIAEAAYMVRYAAWSWSARTGKEFYYAGLWHEVDRANAIVVNWSDTTTHAGYVVAAYYTETGYRHHAKMVLSTRHYDWPDQNCKHAVLVHEMGHAAGIISHSTDQNDVMFGLLPTPDLPYQECHYTLTSTDADMTAYDGGDRCFVELTPDLDLFAPQVGGQQAWLKYDGSGWDLTRIYDSGHDHGCDTVYVDEAGDVYMTDVRSMDMELTDVQLQATGPESWILRFAQ